MFLTNSYAVFSLFHVSYIYCAQYRTPNMKIEKLIERVKAGDTDALKTVYDAYSQRMRNACIKITQEDEDTVDDLVQESFIRAYYSLEKLKDASKFGEWLVAITKNVSLRYLERKRKIQVLSFSEIGDGFDVESSYTSDSKLEEKNFLSLSTSCLPDTATCSEWLSLTAFRIKKLQKSLVLSHTVHHHN